jgi:hypothetical protein
MTGARASESPRSTSDVCRALMPILRIVQAIIVSRKPAMRVNQARAWFHPAPVWSITLSPPAATFTPIRLWVQRLLGGPLEDK